MTTKKLNIDILARDKSKQALSGVQKSLSNVKNRVFSLRTALVGLGAGAVVKSFVDVGKEVESLNVRFKFLFGSAEEGSKAFDNLAKFAGTVPFSLEEISRASGNLAVVAKDADDLNRVLEITGNVAAVTGLDFETTSSQIQRAFAGGIGAADLFRERGVRALLGFEAGAKVTAEETIKRFEELFSGDGTFAGATKDLATTLEGTISMIGDKFFNFQKDVAEGFFEELKGEFGDLNEFLEANEQQIEDIAEAIGKNFAGAISKTSDTIKSLAPAVSNVANALGTTIEGFKSLPSFVQTAGIVSVVLFGKKGALAIGSISFLLGQLDELMERTKELGGLKGLTFEDLEKSLPTLESATEALASFERTHLTLSNSENRLKDENKKLLENLRLLVAERQKEANLLEISSAHTEGYAKFQSMLNDSTKESNKSQVKQQQILGISADMLESNARATSNLSFVQDEARMTMENFRFELDAFNEKFRGNIDEQLNSLQEFKKGFQDAMNEDTFDGFQKAGEVAFSQLKKSLTDFVMTGKLDMKSFEIAVKRAIVEALIGQAVQFALDKATQMFKMKSIKNALGSVYEAGAKALASAPPPLNFVLAGGVIAGGLALVNKIRGFERGGRPPVGQPSIVGEKGAELFVPDQAGTIVPNNKLGGTTNVNITILANDTEVFDDLLESRRATVVNIINDALNSQGKEAII